MPKVNVLGMGPGHKDYILPITHKVISKSEIIIGAKRNLKHLDLRSKTVIEYNSNLNYIKDYIKENKNSNVISVVVSGDTGFHSLLKYLKSFLSVSELNVIPGISSLQYFYSRLGLIYQNSKLLSLHGRDINIINYLNSYESVGILTDKKSNPSSIAKILKNNNISDYTFYVGENLSYGNEKITKLTVNECLEFNTENLNVVILLKE